MTTRAAVTVPEPAAPADEAADRILHLMEDGRVREARREIGQAVDQFPASSRLRLLAVALEPPTARSLPASGQGIDAAGLRTWLREHAGEHAGQWVAIRRGELAGADADRVALHRRLEADQNLRDTVFVRL